MRVQLQHDETARDFAEHLLRLGNAGIPVIRETQNIKLFPKLCTEVPTKEELVWNVFPQTEQNYKSHSWLGERAILAPKNLDEAEVHLINADTEVLRNEM